MIEPTNEMVQLIYERIDFVNHGDDGIREGLAAALALAERDYAISVEGVRGEGLCDCDGTDDDPISPVDGDPLEHHCECLAVLTAAVLLGGVDKTKHAARCLCGRHP